MARGLAARETPRTLWNGVLREVLRETARATGFIARTQERKELLGLAWLGLAWLGLAWLGLAWLGLAWQDDFPLVFDGFPYCKEYQ